MDEIQETSLCCGRTVSRHKVSYVVFVLHTFRLERHVISSKPNPTSLVRVDIPKELASLKVPVITTKKALDKLRKHRSARPGSQIKAQIQEMLHKEFTFQNVHGIDKGSKILGVSDFWRQVAAKMPDAPSPGDVQKQLTRVARQRGEQLNSQHI